MSRHELRTRFIFNATPRTICLASSLAILAGTSTIAIAEIPGVSDAVQAGTAIGGMTAQTLLGCITLGSLVLVFFCVKMLVQQSVQAAQQHADAIAALTKIGENIESMNGRMQTMKCLEGAK